MQVSEDFLAALREETIKAEPSLRAFAPADFRPLTSQGLSHDHITIADSGAILRIPRENQLGMEAAAYLTLQENCFAHGAQSGHVPALIGSLQPSVLLPNGALIVQEVLGRKATRPEDHHAIAHALAAIHKLEPKAGLNVEKKPLASQNFLLTEVFADATQITTISPEACEILREEREKVLQKLAALNENDHPVRFIGGDSHPGNFLIDGNGKAYMVDVEFAMYDSPYIDLADVSLPITQRLEPDVQVWSATDRHNFVKTWSELVIDHIQPDMQAFDVANQAVRLRTLMWLSDWSANSDEDIDLLKITPKARGNWNRMEEAYLEPSNLRDVLQNNIYPHLLPYQI